MTHLFRPYQRRPGQRPFVLGHRGARAHCPENTMLAFERALSDGADGVELDVRMSADGELFISHDDQLILSHTTVRLSRLTSAQVTSLVLAHGQHVPKLRDILKFQAQTGAYINVELKGDVPSPLWMARRAADLIDQHGGAGIFLSSFSLPQVLYLQKRLPHVPVALLLDAAPTFVSARSYVAWHTRKMDKLGVRAAHPHYSVLTPDTYRAMKQHVLVVNVWTVNSVDEAKRLSQLGVDALITDDPHLILSSL